MGQFDEPVFVDRNGRRRRVVIGAGVLLALALVAWLTLVGVSLASSVSS